MPRLFSPLAFALLFAVAPMVRAGPACHVQGQVGGRIINECNEPVPPVAEAQIKQECNGKLPGLEQLGGEAHATVVSACPGEADGACDSPMGAKLRIHYYKRDADQLAAVRSACEIQGGKWIKP